MTSKNSEKNFDLPKRQIKNVGKIKHLYFPPRTIPESIKPIVKASIEKHREERKQRENAANIIQRFARELYSFAPYTEECDSDVESWCSFHCGDD